MTSGLAAFGTETRTWNAVSIARQGVSATRGQPARETYECAVPPSIARLNLQLAPEARIAADEATLALTRFDSELGERVLTFAPVFLRSEAASSSQVEQLTASARAVFTAEIGAGHEGSNAHRIAANTRAMTEAVRLADAITVKTVRSLHEVLMHSEVRQTPGAFRDEAMWIGSRTDSPRGAHYVAPHHSRLDALMHDLVEYADRSDVPAFEQVVITHGQFESIHPFSDGNGQTGRALAQAQLRHTGITRGVVVPVSAGLLADVDGYHRALDAYRAGDPAPLVMVFAAASLRAVDNSRLLVDEIDTAVAAWRSALTARRHSSVWNLLDVLARRPVLTASAAAAELGIASATNVYPALNKLIDAGILKRKAEHGFRGGPLYRADDILGALDRFAERAGRRERLR